MTNDPATIKISQFDVDGVTELEIHKITNEHSRLYCRAIISEGNQAEYIQKATEDITVSIEGEKELFSGIIEKIHVRCVGDVYHLEVYAISKSFLLDSEKKSRSFQESGMSYKKIAEKLFQENGIDLKFEAKEEKVSNLLLQYEETNWEFLRRIASHNNSPLLPESLSDQQHVCFGVPKGQRKGEIESKHYVIRKNLNHYRVSNKNEAIGLSEEDAEEISVFTEEHLLSTGDEVTFLNKTLYIKEVHMILKESVLECEYVLVSQKGMCVPKQYHEKIIGLTLSAEVLKINEDKLFVLLQVDSSQDQAKAYAFPYATPYTAEGSTGLYLMPEVSDKVMAYFPTKDENDAYVQISYRKSGTDLTKDPDIKYFKTPHDKEVKVTKEGIYVITKTDELYLHFDQNKGIEIFSKNPIKITTQDNLTIQSDKSISISAKENISITSGGDFKVHSDKKYTLDSKEQLSMESTDNTVDITGSKDMSLTTDKKLSISASDNIEISGDKNISLDSGKDFSVSSGSKIMMSGSSEAQLSAAGSSMQLDGDINLKGKMIKEN